MIIISKQTLIKKQKKEKNTVNKLSENLKNGDASHTLDTIVNSLEKNGFTIITFPFWQQYYGNCGNNQSWIQNQY